MTMILQLKYHTHTCVCVCDIEFRVFRIVSITIGIEVLGTKGVTLKILIF